MADFNMSYLVGEKGPELFRPGASGTIVPNDKLSGVGGSSSASPVTLNINVSGATIDEIMKKIGNEISKNLA